MKKIIILSLMAILVSCNHSEDMIEPSKLDFEIKVSEMGQRSIVMQVVPSLDDETYYYNILPQTEYVDDASLKLEDMLRFEELSRNSGKELKDVISSQLVSGTVSKQIDGLYPGVTYCIYAYQLDENGFAEGAVSKIQITTTGYGNDIEIGDFFLMDGTIVSKEQDITDDIRSQIAGVIFWLGDPTAEGHDATLRKEHPNCTNGLVMALDTLMGRWSNSNKMVNKWVKTDGRYMEIVFGDRESADQPYNFIRGYNNTKAIEAYNEDASIYDMVVSVINLADYRDSIPLPKYTSDWYIPSVKEMSLMITGEYDGDLWDINAVDGPFPSISEDVNISLEKLGADVIGKWQNYATSTEHSPEGAMAVFSNGTLSGAHKNDPYNIYRPVFAF